MSNARVARAGGVLAEEQEPLVLPRSNRYANAWRLVVVAVAVACVGATVTPPEASIGFESRSAIKIAVIVGPVGTPLTETYRGLADSAARAAETQGATVARAYSPAATPEAVLAAVEGAHIVIYFGHGNGFPSRYSSTLDPRTANGWGLQGPEARGTDEDSWQDGTLAYYGEAWIAAHARPAPGFVMIYSNACYAPGAPDGGGVSTSDEAAARVGYYSRGPLGMGASAYFATDYYAGATRLVTAILTSPTSTYGQIFRDEPNFVSSGLESRSHPSSTGRELWLHKSAYFGDQVNYWYAFAGDPNASPAGSFGAPAGETYEPARSITILAGDHVAYRFGPDGDVADTRHVAFEDDSTALVVSRGAAPGREGNWFEVSDGPLAGFWIRESPSAHLPGFANQSTLYGSAHMTLEVGSYTGFTFTADGAVAGTRTESFAGPATTRASARAIVNGTEHVLITDGVFSGYWVPLSPSVILDLSQAGEPSPEPNASSSPNPVSPAPTPGTTVAPSVAPSTGPSSAPATPGVPTPTVSPSPVTMPPRQSPTPSSTPLVTPTPTPTPTSTPSPLLPTPLPTPISPLV